MDAKNDLALEGDVFLCFLDDMIFSAGIFPVFRGIFPITYAMF